MSDDSIAETRNRIYDVLNETSEEDRMPIGWTIVYESIDSTGRRWLSRLDGSADGSGLPSWQREGYLHSAMTGEWDPIEDCDEDEVEGDEY